MSEIAMLDRTHSPTVYFIDDSATMREVMKIAFRRENIGVVTCQDATTALIEIEQAKPDVVITDVIMPDKDGFEVCHFIKQHPKLSKTPVVLLSGVVNREVADKAFKAQADELIRKPFQPQDLIARVKQFLKPKMSPPAPPDTIGMSAHPTAGLSGIFGNGHFPARTPAPAVPPPPALFPAPPAILQSAVAVATPPARTALAEGTKLRLELLRLENLVKKLQSELAAERDYARALEAHVKTLQEND